MLIIDALMSDQFNIWTMKREIVLGAHQMNDPNFKSNQDDDQSIKRSNCIVQPLLEIVTSRDIDIDDELNLNYNRD